MIYFATLLAYGDNLISLSLLSKLKNKVNVRIVGTNMTLDIADYIQGLDIPIIKISENIPAFYDIKKRGLIPAMRDVFNFVSNFSRHLKPDDTILYETRGLRSRFLTARFTQNIYEPIRNNNVYEDRRNMIEIVFNEQLHLREVIGIRSLPKYVTINPVSRIKEKSIPHHVIKHIISYLKRNRISVQLIDPDKKYFEFSNMVYSYHGDTNLLEAVELLRNSDFYIGPDSLFIHFAYYYSIPFIIFINHLNTYFAPPGVEKVKNYIVFNFNISKMELYSALDGIFAGGRGVLHY